MNNNKIYCDTNIFIYALEKIPQYQEKITALFMRMAALKGVVITSEITLVECLGTCTK